METTTVVPWLHRSPYQIWEKMTPCPNWSTSIQCQLWFLSCREHERQEREFYGLMELKMNNNKTSNARIE